MGSTLPPPTSGQMMSSTSMHSESMSFFTFDPSTSITPTRSTDQTSEATPPNSPSSDEMDTWQIAVYTLMAVLGK